MVAQGAAGICLKNLMHATIIKTRFTIPCVTMNPRRGDTLFLK